jgi:hypothetical protein
LGTLVYNGYNIVNHKRIHRIICTKCRKRFGNDVSMWNLLEYQQAIKKIIYELFFFKNPLKGVAIKWGIRPEMLSRFKKSFVSQMYQQNKKIIEHRQKPLARGVMLADETFMGSRGNSNVEAMVINLDYEVLSINPVKRKALKKSIEDAFYKIPLETRKKLKLLITDGEPSYESIPKIFGGGIIHLVQFHAHNKRGEITVNSYKKLGPHFLHYKILTHWKAFHRDKHELKFKWEIKLIKGRVQAKRGRPRSKVPSQEKPPKWRQKLNEFNSPAFQKGGTAKIYVNFKTNKLSMRAGSKKWMVQMLTPFFKLFKGKCVTTNLMESKNAQVKGNGAQRKQQDPIYGHQLFALHSFIVDNNYIPFTNVAGRPLYKYLMKEQKKKEIGYQLSEGKRNSVQTILSSYT